MEEKEVKKVSKKSKKVGKKKAKKDPTKPKRGLTAFMFFSNEVRKCMSTSASDCHNFVFFILFSFVLIHLQL